MHLNASRKAVIMAKVSFYHIQHKTYIMKITDSAF